VRVSFAKDPQQGNVLKILEENHYYPFGMKHENYNVTRVDFKRYPDTGVELVPMPAVANASYNYKYNGKELQEELGLNMYDYGARNYDPSIGRWMNTDPLAEKYPNISPYVYCVNNPINVIDPDGRDIIYVTSNGVNYQYKNKNFYNVETGKAYDPKAKGAEKTLGSLLKAYQTIENSNDDILKNQLHTLQKSKYTHTIYSTDTEDNQVTKGEYAFTSDTWFNFTPEKLKSLAKSSSDGKISVLEIVVHEMRHQYDWAIGNMKDKVPGNNATDPEEIRAVNNENRARAIEGRKPETSYGGVKIDPEKLKNPPNNKNIMIEQ
jgi:RHS repeat-associated protein